MNTDSAWQRAETISAKSSRPLCAGFASCVDDPVWRRAQVRPKSAQRKRREVPQFLASSGRRSFLTARATFLAQAVSHAWFLDVVGAQRDHAD